MILYPTKAHITRQINDIHLPPNTTREVEIIGLSPTVDEHSIRCEGQGNENAVKVTVMDMSVQLVPNRELFEAGDSDMSDDEEDGENTEDEDPNGWKNDTVKLRERELDHLGWQLTEQNEVVKQAEERLATWERFNKSVSAHKMKADQMSDVDARYEQHRMKIFKAQLIATKRIAQLEKEIEEKERQVERAGREARRQREKIEKAKRKEKSRKQWKKWDKKKEAEYVRNERLRYWPKKVYKVTLLLECSSLDSADSSRRNSVGSVTLASSQPVAIRDPEKMGFSSSVSSSSASLALSYITIEAGWTPRYDLSISSVNKTATITYRAEYANRTSETWKDTKLAFSTSQTNYQGLDDVVPFLHSWRIKLSRYENGDGGILSPEERMRGDGPKEAAFDRAEVFGRVDENLVSIRKRSRPENLLDAPAVWEASEGSYAAKANPPIMSSSRRESSLNLHLGHTISSHGHASGRVQASMDAYGPESRKKEIIYLNGPKAGRRSGLGGNKGARGSLVVRGLEKVKLHRSPSGRETTSEAPEKSYTSHEGGNVYGAEEDPSDGENDEKEDELLNFESSAWEDNGLTATYDVPGTRTLEPSSQTRRHKIASLHAANIHLSHICVPKLRSATFLRAKVRNPSSSVTLLKGSAGVTLDGSFLGTMNLPRVSPGEVFDVSLGVDPAIHVNYPKPSVHRSTQGIVFNKESAQVFSRSIWLDNTRSEQVGILVLDQVPVSEDERLRVGITTPVGLVNEGDSVDAGEAAKQPGKTAARAGGKNGKWGTAVAKLQKNGEIAWTVKLEGGKGVLLKLQYEARLPRGEKIVPT